MSYYPTLEEDVTRAKEILAKGREELPEELARLEERLHTKRTQGGTIWGADVYAAYQLLASFVAAIEAVGPKVCELAIRHEARAKETRG